MNWSQLTIDQQLGTLHAMRVFGGSFAEALSIAWIRADRTNDEILAKAFPNLINQYGPGSRFYESASKV